MRKKSGLTAVLAALALLAGGCGGGGVKEIDASALADSLAGEVAYDDELESLGVELADIYFEMEEGVAVSLYMGSGKTAEAVAVFDAPDEETAGRQLEHVRAYLNENKEAVQDYQPEEVTRIENAVLEQKGKYVILCVSADSGKAKEIIEEAFR